MSGDAFGSLLSAEMVWVAEQIAARYPNLRLQWIEPEIRGPEDERPFAITDKNTNSIIVRLHANQVDARLLRWLDEHDGHKHDLWGQYVRTIEAEKQAREKANREKMEERAEVIHSIQKSPLHHYRINGRKLGAENERPTLAPKD